MDPRLAGVFAAIVALLAWGGVDFLIQRESRRLGIWNTLFFIAFIGSVTLLPFVWHDLPILLSLPAQSLWLLVGVAVVMAITSAWDSEALKNGKLAVMEPVLSAELPLAAILTAALWNESIGFVGWMLIIAIFSGIVLTVTEHHKQLHYHRRLLERGVAYAMATALCTAFLDLLVGAASQQTTSPLLTIWVMWTFGWIVWLGYIIRRGQAHTLLTNLRRDTAAILSVGVLDTIGWGAFAVSTLTIPIAITTAISEAYIVLTIFLGFFINHERIRPHQKIGVAVVIVGVLILAAVTG
jgi:drug/metabolite transporter (DMT)-like permease